MMTKKQHVTPYIKLEYQTLEHPAFETLSGNAFKLLIYVRKRYDGHNNGEIAFSVRAASDLLRCSKDTASRAFQELVDHRLLEPVTKGAFSVKVKHATTWRVTFLHMNGRPGTNDYEHFKPAPNGTATRTDGPAPNSKHGPSGRTDGPSGRTARYGYEDSAHAHGTARSTKHA